MKKMLMTLICLILLCGFSFGQKDLDVIHFKNGAVVKGRIIENVINNYVKIELLDGSVVAYSYSDIDKITKEVIVQKKRDIGTDQQTNDVNIFKKNSFGLGLGIPYGALGVNIDINAGSNLNLSLGIGTTIFAGIGYNVGFKYFFTPIERTFRPRVSAYYGINAIVLKEYIGIDKEDEGESYTGLSIGAGAQWMWGKTKSNGLDFDIIYIATTGYDVDKLKEEGFDVEEYGKVKISIGYRHGF
jgi:hypothetical protein